MRPQPYCSRSYNKATGSYNKAVSSYNKAMNSYNKAMRRHNKAARGHARRFSAKIFAAKTRKRGKNAADRLLAASKKRRKTADTSNVRLQPYCIRIAYFQARAHFVISAPRIPHQGVKYFDIFSAAAPTSNRSFSSLHGRQKRGSAEDAGKGEKRGRKEKYGKRKRTPLRFPQLSLSLCNSIAF